MGYSVMVFFFGLKRCVFCASGEVIIVKDLNFLRRLRTVSICLFNVHGFLVREIAFEVYECGHFGIPFCYLVVGALAL